MDFWDLTKLMFRRWKVSLPMFLVSIAAAAAVAVTVKPDYVMTSYVQLIPLSTGLQNVNQNTALSNPWNALGLTTLGQAAIYATQDQKFLDELKAEGHTINFSLTMTYPDPIVTVAVVGATPADAVATTQLVVAKFESTARSLQKQYGVLDQNLITTQRLDQGQNVKVSGGKVKRGIAAVGGAGILLTAGGTLLFDVLARRRAVRREVRQTTQAAPAPARAGPVPGSLVNGRESLPATRASAAERTERGSQARAARSDPSETAVISRIPAAGDVSETAVLPRTPRGAGVSAQRSDDGGSRAASAPPPPRSRPAKSLLRSGTYRSNTPADSEEPTGLIPADGAGPPESARSDVTIVLRTGGGSGENGNKRG